ncbi:(d)CMP kinase [Mangrovimonas sp. DI 80]|uniref:(d)CMP kinase n=1 Tax=Mangrovimonas sp. DI 80 TaxID=1779330 RepID=UPI0009772481|nr:(d)CMP kinase [Mangrovimonas sp. DI 80]OMP30900.1 cytidylate kinase [Mangrovimonas sp. DI 80]
MQNITIAIDGFSSTGKSTVAKSLAKALGYVYVDSGAMYRAVTLYAMRHKYIDGTHFNREGLLNQLDDIAISFQFNPDLGYAEVYLNGENVEKDIRTLEVSNLVSQIAAVPEVREKQVALQRKIGEDKGVVMDGRDIGTVVFPNAELKIFMTASPETRAKRRYDELVQRGDEVDYESVLQNVQTRDHLDSTRKDSPLIQAEDAILIDNSHLSLQEQFDKILELAQKAISVKNS